MPEIREKNNVQSVIYLVSQLLVRKHSVFLTNFFFYKTSCIKADSINSGAVTKLY